jgi:tagaturonate reductase
MADVREDRGTAERPVKILQFGEGVFLRAFFDWMVVEMNAKAGFGGSIAVVKPREGEFNPAFARQKNRYSVLFKGLQNGKSLVERRLIDSIARMVNPHADFAAFLAEAENPDLLCIVSNTTETGIVLTEDELREDGPAPSFPGKLTQLLRRRYLSFAGDPGKGLVIIPCELIEANGATLKSYVLAHAERWYGDAAFATWIEKANLFVDTLVDRIVTGYSEEAKAAVIGETGEVDDLVVVAEPYHFLAIRGPADLERTLPFRKAGLNVVIADDITPYRLRKIRFLNGSHTFMTMCAIPMGLEIVRSCMEHSLLLKAIRTMHSLETIPCLPLPPAESAAYLDSVIERFSNPFVDHKLSGIAVYSVTKWKARLLPPLADYVRIYQKPPVLLSFSLAALRSFYLKDAEATREIGTIELPEVQGLPELLSSQLADIAAMGVEKALAKAVDRAIAEEGGKP